MSMIVARMEKMKSGNLVGIGNHNQRKTKNHSNKEIDKTRSHLNYDLLQIATFCGQQGRISRTIRAILSGQL